MDIRLKWFYRLGFFLLLFFVLYIFMKLKPIWGPIVSIALLVLTPFLLGAFITYLLHPIIETLHRYHIHRGIAIAVIYLLFFGGLGFAIYKGIPAVIAQVQELASNIPAFIKQYQSLLAKTSNWPFDVDEKIEQLVNNLEETTNAFSENVLHYVMNALDFALIIALIPFISFYMLKDFNAIKRMCWYVTPKQWRRQGRAFLHDVDQSLGNYIRGQIFVCLAIGVISTLLFWLFGLNYPLLLGIIIGVTNVIPYFGPIFGALPAVIIAATMSVKMVLIVIIIIIVLQFVEGNILSPLIVGKSLHMHPLVIMLALLIGSEVAGIIGMIISIPILAIIKVIVMHARIHFRKQETLVDK